MLSIRKSGFPKIFSHKDTKRAALDGAIRLARDAMRGRAAAPLGMPSLCLCVNQRAAPPHPQGEALAAVRGHALLEDPLAALDPRPTHPGELPLAARAEAEPHCDRCRVGVAGFRGQRGPTLAIFVQLAAGSTRATGKNLRARRQRQLDLLPLREIAQAGFGEKLVSVPRRLVERQPAVLRVLSGRPGASGGDGLRAQHLRHLGSDLLHRERLRDEVHVRDVDLVT